LSKKIFVHIGAHKSASTTLQRNFLLNKEKLLQQGLSFITPSTIATSPLGKHFRVLAKGQLEEKNKYQRSLQAARDSLAAIASSPADREHNLLLSWEGFLGHSSLDRYKGIYANMDRIGESLAYIFQDYSYHLLLLIRRQDDFIESCYLQQIKERRHITFSDFLASIDFKNTSWLNITKDLQNQCGKENLSVIPFECIKHLGTAAFIEACLRCFPATVDVSNFSWLRKANSSLSKEGVDLALQALPHIENALAKREFMRIIFAYFSSAKFGKSKIFDDFSRRLLVEYCREDNAHLLEHHVSSRIDAKVGKTVAQYWLGS